MEIYIHSIDLARMQLLLMLSYQRKYKQPRSKQTVSSTIHELMDVSGEKMTIKTVLINVVVLMKECRDIIVAELIVASGQ